MRLLHRWAGWHRDRPAPDGRHSSCVRGAHLAAPARTHHAAGAALSGGDAARRPSLSPGVRPTRNREAAAAIAPQRLVNNTLTIPMTTLVGMHFHQPLRIAGS